MASSGHNPYVGWRPFRADEEQAFFGRNIESARLADMVIADRIVLLHAPSGTGKTSLVLAGLLPRLKALSEISDLPLKVLPIIRVGGEHIPGHNRFAYALGQSLNIPCVLPEHTGRIDLAASVGIEFAYKLNASLVASNSRQVVQPVLVFDQFEEVFLRDPDQDQQRKEFFDFLGSLLLEGQFRALFIIRDDYVGALESYRRFIPTGLDSRMRLEPLGREQATEAIIKPAELEDVRVTPKALNAIMQRLGTQTIESLHLQVVCATIWDNVVSAPAIDGRIVKTIDEEDVIEFGDLDQALRHFLQGRILEVVERLRRNSLHTLSQNEKERVTKGVIASLADDALELYVIESRIRGWLERKLIVASTGGFERVPVRQGAHKTADLDNSEVDELYSANIVGIFHKKSSETWYELAHEKLIAPLKRGNEEWRGRLSGLHRAAQVWQQNDKADARLASGLAHLGHRREFQRLSPYPEAFAIEHEYIKRSATRLHERRWERLGKKIMGLFLFAFVVATVLAAKGIYMLMQGNYELSQVTQISSRVTSQSHRAQEHTSGGPNDALSELRDARAQLDPLLHPEALPKILDSFRSKIDFKKFVSLILSVFREQTSSKTIDAAVAYAREEWLRDSLKTIADAPLLGYLPGRQLIASTPEGLVLARRAVRGFSLLDLRPIARGDSPTSTDYTPSSDDLDSRGSANGSISHDGRRFIVVPDTDLEVDTVLTNALDGNRSLQKLAVPIKLYECIEQTKLSYTGTHAVIVTRDNCGSTSDGGKASKRVLYFGLISNDGLSFKTLRSITLRFEPVDLTPLEQGDGFFFAENCAQEESREPSVTCNHAHARAIKVLFSRADTSVVDLPVQYEIRSLARFSDDTFAVVARRDNDEISPSSSIAGPCTPSAQLFLTTVALSSPAKLIGTSELPVCTGRDPRFIDASGGHLLIVGDKVQEGLSSETPRACIYDLADPRATRCDLNIADARFSPDAKFVATVRTQGLIRVWYGGPSIASTEVPPLATMNHAGGSGNSLSLAFFSDKIVSSNSTDIRIWQLQNIPQSVQTSEHGWTWIKGFSDRPFSSLDMIEMASIEAAPHARTSTKPKRFRLTRYRAFGDGPKVLKSPLPADFDSVRSSRVYASGGNHFAVNTRGYSWDSYVNLDTDRRNRCQFSSTGVRIDPEVGERGAQITAAAPVIGYFSRRESTNVLELCDLQDSDGPIEPQTVCVSNGDTQFNSTPCPPAATALSPFPKEYFSAMPRLSRSGLRLLMCRDDAVCRVFAREPGKSFRPIGFFERPAESARSSGPSLRTTTRFRFSPSENFLVIDSPPSGETTRRLFLVDLPTGSQLPVDSDSPQRPLVVRQLQLTPVSNEPLQGYVFAEPKPEEMQTEAEVPKESLLFTYSSAEIRRYDISAKSNTAKFNDALRVPGPVSWITVSRGDTARCLLIVTDADPHVVELWNWSAKVKVGSVSLQDPVGWAWYVDESSPAFWAIDLRGTSYRIDARDCVLDDKQLFAKTSARIRALGHRWPDIEVDDASTHR